MYVLPISTITCKYISVIIIIIIIQIDHTVLEIVRSF